ncbi:hypothetical protein RMCBS344292_03970 [Rhizopus microsporus]|nr:hypothetical protein RMCBS344292_03970 [Rhizopus microsporus]
MLNILKGKEQKIGPSLYPIRGLFHLFHHPKKYSGPILLSILKVVASSAITVIPLIRYGYGFQLSIIRKVYQTLLEPQTHRTAISFLVPATAGIICCAEAAAITIQLGTYFVGSIRTRLFDAILQERNALPVKEDDTTQIAEIVGGPAQNRDDLRDHAYLSPQSIAIITAQQDDDSWGAFFLRPAIFIMTLPLNIIPVIGPAGFICIQALFRAGEAHRRYFNVYHWTPAQVHRRIEQKFVEYFQFGLMATVLEMIPFVGYLFIYTNQIGGAMWAMDLHDRKLLEPKNK